MSISNADMLGSTSSPRPVPLNSMKLWECPRQLLAVLPPQSSPLLPQRLRPLLEEPLQPEPQSAREALRHHASQDRQSPIADFYPLHFESGAPAASALFPCQIIETEAEESKKP